MSVASDSVTSKGVSVVLCTYNGERYLRDQLDSLFAQERLPDELIAVDDDSSDGTWDLLNEFYRRAPEAGIRMVLKRNRCNLGYRRNFESALALASMPLVFLCDQDDVWHPNKIARMEASFLARPSLLLLHADARLVDADGADMRCGLFEALKVSAAELSGIHGGEAFKVLLRRSLVTGATAAFRREILSSAFPFSDIWVHDEWLALVSAASGEVDCLEEKLVDYRQHDSNQIGVRKQSIAEKLGAHGVSRRDYLRDVETGLQQLLQRPDFVRWQNLLLQRLKHVRARANLPSGALARVRWVLAEALTGRYSRFSFGLRSIVADLLGLN